MRRRFFAGSVVILILVLGIYSVAAFHDPTPVLASQLSPLRHDNSDQLVDLRWPSSGQAAIGAVGFGVIATHGAQQEDPTASVAKIMNALMVLKAKPLAVGQTGPDIPITPADVNIYNTYVAEDGSVAKVTAGEHLSEYQALEAMLLPSADNLADTLANWAYGSINSYSLAANAYALRLGMLHTRFGTADASGYSPETTSTAHDLVLLGEAALNNPVIAQIVAKPKASIPVAGTVKNVNWLLGSYGINGIKTGNTNQAGGVYLFSARQPLADEHEVTIVGAILAEPTLQAALDDAVPLLTSVRSHFSLTVLITAGQVVGKYRIPWAGTVNAVASRSVSTVTWSGQDTTPKVTLHSITAPLSQGSTIGSINFPVTDETVPVTLAEPINMPGWHWRVTHVL